MSYEKYLLTREVEKVALDLPYDEDEEKIEVSIRPLSWAKKNSIVSQCTNYSESGVAFDGQRYINEVLKYIVTEAPWGATNDMFLSKVDLNLGGALEKLVPSATDQAVMEKSENLA
tara:strand:+ start:152 stop:499 length:348 start_codon:yes stop_codon:yes gene_type:complete